MASPQKEEGYTAIANEIMDALCRTRISGMERQILDVIFRKTYGWNKCEDAIALSQFVEMTGISKPNIIHSIKKLLSKSIITVVKNDNNQTQIYKFTKDYHKWKPLSKLTKLSKKTIGVVKNDNKPLSILSTTKDTTKDTITKDINNNKRKGKSNFIFLRPEWLPEETWKRFDEMRSKIKKPLTDYAAHLITIELQKIKEKHNHDPVDVLNQSTRNNYQDVYPLKDGGNGNGTGRSSFTGSAGQVITKKGGAKSDGEPWPADKEY